MINTDGSTATGVMWPEIEGISGPDGSHLVREQSGKSLKHNQKKSPKHCNQELGTFRCHNDTELQLHSLAVVAKGRSLLGGERSAVPKGAFGSAKVLGLARVGRSCEQQVPRQGTGTMHGQQ